MDILHDNDKTICALFINNIANCNNASCIITVKAFDMNFFIYPLKAPPSEFNKPMQAIGIAIFIKNTTISGIIIFGDFIQTLTITRIAYRVTHNKYGHEIYAES